MVGYLAEALLNFLLRLGFSYGDKEVFSMQEMLDLFTLENLSSSPSIYNESKLLWLNNLYIKNTQNKKLEELLNINLESSKKEVLLKETKERANTLIELKDMIDSILKKVESYDEKFSAKIDKEAKEMLVPAIDSINNFNSIEDINYCLHNFVETKNIKIGKLFSAMRCALLGKSGGIGINELIFILGKDETKDRIDAFLNKN